MNAPKEAIVIRCNAVIRVLRTALAPSFEVLFLIAV
jgi:hypothetical protein